MYRSEVAVFRTLLAHFGDRHEPNLSEPERSALLRCHGDLTTRMYGAGTLASVAAFGISRGYPLVVRGEIQRKMPMLVDVFGITYIHAHILNCQ